MKKTLPWLLLAAVVLGIGYLWAQDRAEKAVLAERFKAEAEKVAMLNGQIAAVHALVKKGEDALARSDAAAAAREEWFREQMKEVATATPQQLVDDGSRLLGALDISTDGKTVTMGLETWRRAVSIFRNEEEYRLVREPRWNEDKAGMQGIIRGLKVAIDLKDQKIVSLENMKADLAKELGIQKKLTLAEKALWAAGGFIAGKGMDGLAKLF